MQYSIHYPVIADLFAIENILTQWVEAEEAEKYVGRIKSYISGQTEYNMAFWVIKQNDHVIGVGGLADPLPSIVSYAETSNPGELKILYLDNNLRGKGLGRKFLTFLEDEAVKRNYNELLVRSGEQYRETAFEFYKKMGYIDLGQMQNSFGKPMELFKKIIKHIV